MLAVAAQNRLRQGHSDLWQPLLWEGTSFVVASVIAWLQLRRIPRQDRLLPRPWRWFLANLGSLPLIAVGFVAVVYALRHGVYALLGESYEHPSWGTVFGYETVKFALFYLLFAAIVFGVRSHVGLSAERARADRARALQHHAQMLQLTQQIEPHFLFNALNTIAETVHTDAEAADTLLSQLAALLRAATDLTRQPESSLDEELRLLEGYAAIMCKRFAGRVTLRFAVDPAVRSCRVPTLVLLPLLENAFRHGVEQRPGPATILVSARCDGAQLKLAVEDDAGTLPEQLVFGVGLSNLQQRLATRFGDQAALALASPTGRGVAATITLPCEY